MTKKIKNVETPIDQRETFVSIQKNFADSDASAREKLATLYALQKADSAIDKIICLRGELPGEVEALNVEVKEKEAKIAKLGELVEAYGRTIAVNKEKIVDCDTQIEVYRKQLENIDNSRAFGSIEKEIEYQDLERQIAEKNIGETKVAVSQAKAEMEEIQEKIAVLKSDLDAKMKELDGIVDSTSKEEQALRDSRQKLAAKIDGRTLSAYDRIRASVHNHLAVVTVYGEACGGCFNTIIPQRLVDIRSGKKLIICEHCGRIVVDSSIEE